MSYIIEQKIKGKIYLYKVESYWDKEKKQARQKRVYLGPKGGKRKTPLETALSRLTTHNYGNVFFLKDQIKQLGLLELLQEIYPDYYNELLALAMYEVSEGSPSYLFSCWIQEQNLPEVKQLNSANISSLYSILGKDQKSSDSFITAWIKKQNPIEGVYYDITSISSYSTKIDFVEWGYNRDKENLPQINMGVVCDMKSGLPVYYKTHPGSIVDVSTLSNCIKYLQAYSLKDIIMVLDRGFCSTANILNMSSKQNQIRFIQPLSFSLKKVKELVAKHKKELSKTSSAFIYNQEVLHHVADKIEFEDVTCDVHVFYNEKAELDQRHKFLAELLRIESAIAKCKDKMEFDSYVQNQIPQKQQQYFKWSTSLKCCQKDIIKIDEYLANLGYFVIATNEKTDKISLLEYYRNRDTVEKIFDVMKNEMDGSRLRVHSDYNTNGKLLVKFIALIIYMQISQQMKKAKLFDRISLKEMLNEFKKIKITRIENFEPIISEISKKNKKLFSDLKTQMPT
jgi:transposase